MSREELDRYWSDPKNWSGVYDCPEDPRVVVPKRRNAGWTMNFGHSLAIPTLFVGLLLPFIPIVLLIRYQLPFPWFVGGMVACIGLTLLGCHWEATRSRE